MDNSDYKFILSIVVAGLMMIAFGVVCIVVCTYHENQLIANAADPIEMKCALSGRSYDSACVIAALSRK